MGLAFLRALIMRAAQISLHRGDPVLSTASDGEWPHRAGTGPCWVSEDQRGGSIEKMRKHFSSHFRGVCLVFVVFIAVLILKVHLHSASREFYFPYWNSTRSNELCREAGGKVFSKRMGMLLESFGNRAVCILWTYIFSKSSHFWSYLTTMVCLGNKRRNLKNICFLLMFLTIVDFRK